MNFIIHPLTKTKHSLFSKDGKKMLKKYIKHVQTGGSMDVDRRTGKFIGKNNTGDADARFFNNLGIRVRYGSFNTDVLSNFIYYPLRRHVNLNMSLMEALHNIDSAYLQIDDARNPGPERDINNAIQTRVDEAQGFNTHDPGHVHWAAELSKLRNFIRIFKVYYNTYFIDPNLNKFQKKIARNTMIQNANQINNNQSLYYQSFEHASATPAQFQPDLNQASRNRAADPHFHTRELDDKDTYVP